MDVFRKPPDEVARDPTRPEARCGYRHDDFSDVAGEGEHNRVVGCSGTPRL